MNSSNSETIIFSNDDIDPTTLANTILQQNNLPKYLREITNEITNLNEQLQSHIISKHDDLMSHAVGIEKLEGVLEMMCSRTTNLRNHTDKIRVKLEEPFNNLSARIQQLDNMQVTCELLRKIIRVNCLVQRLQDQKRDPTKASASINELRFHFNTTDWKGIKILENHYELTNTTANNLIEEAWTLLKLVKETNNQAMLGIALQIFRNLNMLTASINQIVTNWQTEYVENLRKTVDINAIMQSSFKKSSLNSGMPKGPGRATIPIGEQMASFRAAFWTIVDKLVNNVESNMSNILILAKTLHIKRDMNSQKCLIDCLLESDENEQLNEFCIKLLGENVSNAGYQYQLWISEKLAQVFHEAISTDESGFLKKTLENEYPKLLKLFMDLNTKLLNHVIMQKDDVNRNYVDLDNTKPNQKYFKTFLIEYEQAFLSISLSKLFDIAQFAFNKTDKLPNEDDIVNFIKNISTELTLASADQNLLSQSCKNVGKMIDIICTKFEQCVSTDNDSNQIIGQANSNQKCNFTIINLLYKFKTSTEHSIIRQLRLSEPNQAIIQEKLDHCIKLQATTIQPLLNNITSSIEEIIATVHSENFLLPTIETEPSLMMLELERFLKRVRIQYINEISDENLMESLLKSVVNQATEVYLIHLCSIRPLNDFGKQKLLVDIDQFETSIKQLCLRNQSITNVMDSQIYRKLRGLKSILSQSLADIIENYQSVDKRTGNSFPISYLLHHLFSLSPPELKSPHTSAGWPIERYVAWLLNHPSEMDRLSFIKGALDAYANMIRLKEQKHYAELYIHMMSILDSVY